MNDSWEEGPLSRNRVSCSIFFFVIVESLIQGLDEEPENRLIKGSQ